MSHQAWLRLDEGPKAPMNSDLRLPLGVGRPLSHRRIDREDRDMTSAFSVRAAKRASTPSALAGCELHETHTGVVDLVGDRIYKVEKPMPSRGVGTPMEGGER